MGGEWISVTDQVSTDLEALKIWLLAGIFMLHIRIETEIACLQIREGPLKSAGLDPRHLGIGGPIWALPLTSITRMVMILLLNYC